LFILGIIFALIAAYYYELGKLFKKAKECNHNQRGPGGMCTLCLTPLKNKIVRQNSLAFYLQKNLNL